MSGAPDADAAPPDRSATLKALLQQKVFGGQASAADIRLLIALCKEDGDTACVEHARQATPNRNSN